MHLMAATRELFTIFVPELNRLDPDEADHLVRACRLRDLFDTRFAWDFLKLLVLAAAAAAALAFLGRWLGIPNGVIHALAGIIISLAAVQAINITLCQPMRRHVRRYLAARGSETCIRCGRDLQDSDAPRCPKCRARP